MKKIPTLFDRDWNGDRSKVLDVPHPDCTWVFQGEGIATRKIDGTSCLVRDGKLFRRRELRKGDAEPVGFTSEGTDPETGKTVGWIAVAAGTEDRYHREAFEAAPDLADGTYELVGPKIQGNPEQYEKHLLVPHHGESLVLADVPRTFDALKIWLAGKDFEGIVWHHPDGRMAKIKLRDFGLSRPRKA
jgi:hypothetical protein